MADIAQMSQSDIEALAKAIREASQPKGFSPTAFCNVWSKIKPILTELQPIAALIPVVGVIISGALATLLALGNAAAIAFRCPT